MIYLDNAASTPVLEEVKAKLINTLDIYGNPSSIHDEGVNAKRIIRESKNIIADKINCSPEELYFTSGATMSNSVVLGGFQGDLICSSIEHEDILMRVKNRIPVDECGFINMDILKYCLNNQNMSTLYSIQMANSEIGIIQNIKKISKLIHSYPDSYLHVDATQYIPHFSIDVKDLGIDALSMSGQKIGCIKGIGLLYVSNQLLNYIDPIIYGKQGLIGGTENVLGIACLGEAFKQLHYNKEETQLRDLLINGLNGKLVGPKDNRLPNNVCMLFEGCEAISVVQLLNEYGICCSAGSACSSGNSEPSSTLMSIGLTPEQAKSCVRFTLSKNTTENEINEVIKTTNMVVDILRS